MLSDGQPEEPKSGNRDKTGKPRDYIKSILLFQCNASFLLAFLVLLPLDSVPHSH